MAKLPEYFYFRVKADKLNITVEDASDVDVAEIIMCRDCKYYNSFLKDGICDIHSEVVDNDYFCADGKRKENI